jgi:hypothetical protein
MKHDVEIEIRMCCNFSVQVAFLMQRNLGRYVLRYKESMLGASKLPVEITYALQCELFSKL